MITKLLSNVATTVAASTLGTTSLRMGSMPITSRASISSLMVRAPKSAQMAVEPAPATTSTVVSGPSWVTAPNAAPAPDISAAPNSASKTFNVKVNNTVSGIAAMMVGRIVTLSRNQACRTNSRHSSGQRKTALTVNEDIRAKPPTCASGRLTWPPT